MDTYVYIVQAAPEDRKGDGIWGVFSTRALAERALSLKRLRAWDSVRSNAFNPDNEIPRQPDERVISVYTVDFALRPKIADSSRDALTWDF